MTLRLLVLAGTVALLAACSSDGRPARQGPPGVESGAESVLPSGSTADSPASRLMPDLVGLPAARAGERLGELGLGSSWGRPVTVDCRTRPGTVVSQRPAPGTPVGPATTVLVRTAAMDLGRFRGPCEARGEAVGEISEADVALARAFYRFASDPSLGGPFAGADVWVGIEEGMESTVLRGDALTDLAAWELGTGYAERSGPLSPLDTLAGSGGYYEVRRGVAATCPGGNDAAPPGLGDLRAISLTAPGDVVSACLDWWAVTLFVDSRDRIRGVALRLGSP